MYLILTSAALTGRSLPIPYTGRTTTITMHPARPRSDSPAANTRLLQAGRALPTTRVPAWSNAATATENCTAPAPSYPDFSLSAHDAASYIASFVMSRGKLSIPLQVRSYKYGTVRLSVSGLPSGVSASFSQSTLVSGSPTLYTQRIQFRQSADSCYHCLRCKREPGTHPHSLGSGSASLARGRKAG